MQEWIEWWNNCGLAFQDKLTVLLLAVERNNKGAKELLELIDSK